MLDESDDQENKWTLTSCKIEWRVENFCLAIRTDRYVVHSPEFILRGCNDSFTKWRMNLIVNGEECNNGVFSFVLERLGNLGPNNISLNWEVSLKAGDKIFEPVESDFSFSGNSEKDIYLQPVNEVLRYLPPFVDDTLVIHCFVIVGNNTESTNRYKSPDYGLKCLSEDLLRLKKHNINELADVILKVGEREIYAHKVILCRNKVLESYIEKAQNNIIELKNLDYEAVDKFVSFLYSGNIAEILTKPSVSMIKCITHFDNEILKHCYIPEELTIFTRINAETHEFHWSVSDILSENSTTISSPPIRRLNVDTVWQLNISLQHDDCISLYADIIGGKPPLYFCLEFGVQDEQGQVFHPKRLIRFNQRYDNLGFKKFIEKSDLNSSIYIDDTIRILFKIRTSDGTQESSVGCRNLSFVSSMVKSPYEQLSHDLIELLKTKKFCDTIIKFNNKLYYAHRCILASRSVEYSRKICPSSKNDVVTLEQIEEDSFEFVLDYLYGGVLKDREVNQVIKMYDSALVLGIQSLLEECQVILKAAGQKV